MKYFFLFSILMFTLISCEPDLKHAQNLSGDWRGVKWTKDGKKTTRTARALIMRFDGTNLFAAHIGESPMKGNYRLDGNKLYLTEHGKTEQKYRIQKLTSDSLYLNVHHRGSDETMVFIRKYKKDIPLDEEKKEGIIKRSKEAVGKE